MKKQNGFTLIEMMLVIAVVAIMTMLSIMTYRRHAETARIDKVAIEMQHILEAALAYNVDKNGQWPDANDVASCSTRPPTNNFVDNYIPNQNVQSSYGPYFCWASEGNTVDGDPRLFWVALKILNNDIALASRIAARLPNAVITADPTQLQVVPCDRGDCYVRAEVVRPSAMNNKDSGMVVATGDCPSHNDSTNANEESSTCTGISSSNGSKYRINFAACPDKDLPRVTVFPNFIRFPKDNYPGFTVKDIYAERTQDPCTTTIRDDGERRQNCDVSVHATTCIGAGPYRCGYIDIADAKHPGSIGASYIVACVPQQTS